MMSTRATLAYLTSIVLVVAVGWLVYWTGKNRPFRAEELPKAAVELPDTVHVSGTVTKISNGTLTVRAVWNEAYVPFTITTTSATRVIDMSGRGRFTVDDIAVGDFVNVTPVANRSDTTREAAYIDLAKAE